jgi:hypothetical protein
VFLRYYRVGVLAFCLSDLTSIVNLDQLFFFRIISAVFQFPSVRARYRALCSAASLHIYAACRISCKPSRNGLCSKGGDAAPNTREVEAHQDIIRPLAENVGFNIRTLKFIECIGIHRDPRIGEKRTEKTRKGETCVRLADVSRR